MIHISIERLPEAEGLSLPTYATAGAAGMDLRASEDLTILPGRRAAVSTGLKIAVPDGYEAQIRPRSGLALRHGLALVNSPGTIDSDYRGVVKVILINLGEEPIVIARGDRIAQMIVAPVVRVAWNEVDAGELDETPRHENGFGHTGIQ